MKRLRMVHPNLPGRQILVRPAGVAARRQAGWRLLDEVSEPDRQEAPRRRRRTDESEAS